MNDDDDVEALRVEALGAAIELTNDDTRFVLGVLSYSEPEALLAAIDDLKAELARLARR